MNITQTLSIQTIRELYSAIYIYIYGLKNIKNNGLSNIEIQPIVIKYVIKAIYWF